MQPFASNPWFKSLPEADAAALLDNSFPIQLAQNQVLFSRGDSYDGRSGAFFGVIAGAIKLSISHEGGKEVILAVVEPGNWFGAGPTLERCARGHNATALAECEIRAVTAMSFAALMKRNGFAQAIARQMAQRLRLAYRSMGATALLSTRERILRLLTVLAYGGVTLAENRKQSISTSQDMLALMLGISRPTLNKELHALSELGLIGVHYGRIELKQQVDVETMYP